MRGKVILYQSNAVHLGITPAYAGKSAVVFSDAYDNLGSPPPMRGKAVTLPRCTPSPRITPAYAGKRLSYPDYVQQA